MGVHPAISLALAFLATPAFAAPDLFEGFGVLVDTDNTGLEAEAWFAELSLESTPRGKP